MMRFVVFVTAATALTAELETVSFEEVAKPNTAIERENSYETKEKFTRCETLGICRNKGDETYAKCESGQFCSVANKTAAECLTKDEHIKCGFYDDNEIRGYVCPNEQTCNGAGQGGGDGNTDTCSIPVNDEQCKRCQCGKCAYEKGSEVPIGCDTSCLKHLDEQMCVTVEIIAEVHAKSSVWVEAKESKKAKMLLQETISSDRPADNDDPAWYAYDISQREVTDADGKKLHEFTVHAKAREWRQHKECKSCAESEYGDFEELRFKAGVMARMKAEQAAQWEAQTRSAHAVYRAATGKWHKGQDEKPPPRNARIDEIRKALSGIDDESLKKAVEELLKLFEEAMKAIKEANAAIAVANKDRTQESVDKAMAKIKIAEEKIEAFLKALEDFMKKYGKAPELLEELDSIDKLTSGEKTLQEALKEMEKKVKEAADALKIAEEEFQKNIKGMKGVKAAEKEKPKTEEAPAKKENAAADAAAALKKASAATAAAGAEKTQEGVDKLTKKSTAAPVKQGLA